MTEFPGIYGNHLKSVLDKITAVVLMILLSPLFIALITFKIITDDFSIFFLQPRLGKGEKVFIIYKFKTLKRSSSQKDFEYSPGGPWLRKYSLDELPQLWNVVRGDMSLIGPRPLLVNYKSLFTDEQRIRHQVKPGITGLAQVNGRNRINWETRFRYDAQYIEYLSVFMDASIVLSTVKNLFRQEDVLPDFNQLFEG